MMKYIIHGDFSFPLNFDSYFNNFVYLLNNQGLLNFDHIIRFWSKLPITIFYWITDNNILVSYFYIIFVFSFLFFSFYSFLKYFFPKKKTELYIIASLFFVFNPVFLGNISKLGLVYAVGFLSLVLVFIHKYFTSRKVIYLLITVLFLNFSLIHPFTFIVNTLIGLSYFLYLFFTTKSITYVRGIFDILKFVLIFLLFNFYIIFPGFFSLSSLNRAELSDSLNKNIEINNGWSSGITLFNTKTILNSFSLYKPLLRDYEFFNNEYKNIYFLLSFILLIFILHRTLIKGNKKDRRIIILLVVLLLLLFALSSMKFSFLRNTFIYIVDNLPAGWAFRSPLKWQLYIPFILSILLFFSMKDYKSKKDIKIKLLFILLVIIFLNAFLFKEIYNKLLLPKYFYYIRNYNDLIGKKILLVKNKSIINLDKSGYKFAEELTILRKSYNINVIELYLIKDIKNTLETILKNNYFDYIIFSTCMNLTSLNNNYELYGNYYNGYCLYKNKFLRKSSFIKKNNVWYLYMGSIQNTLRLDDIFNNKGWQLYLGDLDLFGKSVSLWGKTEISKQEIIDYVKKYYREELKGQGYPKKLPNGQLDYKYYKLNPDGSIDVELTLYFKPQLYFYIGLGISGITFLFLILWLMIDSIRNRRREDILLEIPKN